MQLVAFELRKLGAKAPVLLMDIDAAQIRVDGRPYANAKPRHPGVVLSFTASDGKQMQFPCDAFDHWSANLRAIALALEALRKIDRYGVTRHGEQYKGWQALPAPNGDHWTKDEAMSFLGTIIGGRARILPMEDALRECEKLTHPDMQNGDSSKFKKVQQARKLLLGN